MTRSIIVLGVLFSSLLTLVGEAVAQRERPSRPNVILVITDDQGYGDLSCHGNPVLKTPHLDALYEESVRLTDFHVSPTCAPTRGALMSGHFTNRAGPWHTIMGRSMLFEGEKTLGDAFSASGYATGMFGKWHLGDNYPFRPEERGFDEVVRHGGGGVGQTPDCWNNAYFDDRYFHNRTPEPYEGYCTDAWFSEAKRFIAQSADEGRPFFAYISTNAPHSPFHCPEEYWKPYEAKVSNAREAIFFGMIANIDENIGALRAWLEEEGLARDTVFLFMTDNGTASGARIFNAGMRGQKGSEYDGGHRVPCFVHWPAAGLDRGRDVPHLTAHIDILPTLVELCDLAPLDDYEVDGRSLVPILFDAGASWPDRTIITDSQRVRDPIKWRKSSTMTQRWRLINGKELYDIQADPGQKTDVADEYPQVVERLRADYEAWWADISPVFEKDARIIVGTEMENPSRLTCHDWLTSGGSTPWHQSAIRGASRGIGEWALKVAEPGTYRITLRRWPAVVPAAIREGIPAGDPVPGLTAYRETPGKPLPARSAGIRIGDIEREKPVGDADEEIAFDVQLSSGEVNLLGYFNLEDGTQVGSYYAYVEKLP